jgi:hypothetical protein
VDLKIQLVQNIQQLVGDIVVQLVVVIQQLVVDLEI